MTARGLRNNNPGNIRKSETCWMGLSEEQPDPDFFCFSEAKYGLRALYKLLLNYRKLYRLDTVREIISRWAPPSENDTEAYIAAICKATGLEADQVIDLGQNKPLAVRFIAAIVQHENGSQPYSDEEIKTAMQLA